MAASKILVVDDQPINVQLLKHSREREGLTVVTAYNGLKAIDLVQREKSDLILLDVAMPDMNGIKVNRRFQAQEETRTIPIIFTTARSKKESRLESLGVGAVDDITKPIDRDETLARVQTQLHFVAINRQLLDLTRRLEETSRAASVGDITQGIAYNLSHLLAGVVGYLDLIQVYYDRPEKVKPHAQHVNGAVQRIVSIIKPLNSLVVKIRPPLAKTSLARLLGSGIARFHVDYNPTHAVTTDNPLGDQVTATNIEVSDQIFSEVLMNTWEDSENPPTDPRTTTVTTRMVEKAVQGNVLEVRIEDHGHGIDPEIRDRMFEPFISSKHTVGVGMGLTVARHALRALGGEVTMADRPGGGTRCILIHPLESRIKKPIA